ncbi:MAG: isoprenylcysteine carboxylmethyltransferase family protein [Gammaproteobacteria bacterium]
MRHYDVVIATCWLLFFIVWAVLARIDGGRGGRSSPTNSAVRLGLVVLIALAVYFGNRLPVGEFARATTLAAGASGAAAVGAVVCVIGLAFAIWARVALGRHWGMPMTLRDTPELVTWGPYAYVRHPIYTGLATMMIGTTLVYPLGVLWCAMLIPYMIFGARREERDMERLFPDVYLAYKQRSKMLVPFVF